VSILGGMGVGVEVLGPAFGEMSWRTCGIPAVGQTGGGENLRMDFCLSTFEVREMRYAMYNAAREVYCTFILLSLRR